METLIIILIVTMIVQTVIFVYSNFIDLSRKRLEAAAQEALTNAHADFCNEKKKFSEILAEKNDALKKQGKQVVEMQAEIIERGKRIRHLENLVLNPNEQMLVVWRPDIEQIKSVYDAARVMKQTGNQTEAEILKELWENLKKQYLSKDEDLM
jgi:hypothetical protein